MTEGTKGTEVFLIYEVVVYSFSKCRRYYSVVIVMGYYRNYFMFLHELFERLTSQLRCSGRQH